MVRVRGWYYDNIICTESTFPASDEYIVSPIWLVIIIIAVWQPDSVSAGSCLFSASRRLADGTGGAVGCFWFKKNFSLRLNPIPVRTTSPFYGTLTHILSLWRDYLGICFRAPWGKYLHVHAMKHKYAANVALCGPRQWWDVMWALCCLMSVSGEGRYMSSVPPANPEQCPSLSASLTPPVMMTKTHTL